MVSEPEDSVITLIPLLQSKYLFSAALIIRHVAIRISFPSQPKMEAFLEIATKPVYAVKREKRISVAKDIIKASDALPLSLYLTNVVFFTLFFSVVYFLFSRWREKIRASILLHVVTFPEIVVILALVASLIYLSGFLGIDFVQCSILQSSGDVWSAEEEKEDNEIFLRKENARTVPCGPVLDDSVPSLPPRAPTVTSQKLFDGRPLRLTTEEDTRKIPCGLPPQIQVVSVTIIKLLDEKHDILAIDKDEEIINSILFGIVLFHSLESKLGDCRRSIAIKREALQRLTGKSLLGLPLDEFDHDSVLRQCCEMLVRYVHIPVGVAETLLLNRREFSVPFATTEGCFVASTKRGCKAIHLSDGATSTLLKDGMTRAPVARFKRSVGVLGVQFFFN